MQKNKRGILKRFLFSYVIIFSIPLIVGLFIYQNMVKIIEEDCKEYNLTMLEQCKDLMDARMQDINGIIVQLNDNLILNDLMFRLNFDNDESIYEIMKLWTKSISVFSLSNHFISDFFIYQDKEDFLISPKNVFTHLSEVYGDKLDYGGMTLEQFKALIFKGFDPGSFLPEKELTYKKGIQGDNGKVVVFLRSLPLNSSLSRGSIVFFIPTANIHQVLQHMYTKDGGSYFIMDGKGKVLLSYPENARIPSELLQSDIKSDRLADDVKVDGKRAVKYQIRSNYNGLVYVSVMPYSIVMKRLDNIGGLMVACLLVMICGGLLLSYVLAYRNSKPIAEVVSFLASSSLFSRGAKNNDFDFLKGSVTKLISTNKSLQYEIDQKFVQLRSDFLGRLFRGGFVSSYEVETYLPQANGEAKQASYTAVITSLKGYGNYLDEDLLRETSAIKLLLNNYFEKHFDNILCFYDYDLYKTVILLPVFPDGLSSGKAGSFREEMDEVLKSACTLMKERFNLELSCAAGITVDDIMRVGDCASTALRALQCVNPEKRIIWFSDLPNRPVKNYSLELEAKIMVLARAGCYDEIEAELANLYQSCFIDSSPSGALVKQLVYDLKGTLFQISAGELSQNGELADRLCLLLDGLDHLLPYDAIWQELLKAYREICSFFNEQKRSHNVQMGNQIQEYISKNYHDPQLSLSSAAGYFNISEVYVSQLFKEQTGQNFSDYVESMRIEEACRGLRNPEPGIQKIAGAAGYNSAHTFSRAFKRVMGISPTAYREANSSDKAF